MAVNGKRTTETVSPQKFATIRRKWKTGDRIELDLPLRLRLEPIDERHPQTVAPLSGPLVLFAMTDVAPAVTSKHLLAASKIAPKKWQVASASGSLALLPFTAIGDEPYATYLTLRP